jgi:hypothetical protein
MPKTMNNHVPLKDTHRSDLRPLPMRITQLQFERLQNVRARDGLAIQEHVRRALDIYLAGVDAAAEPQATGAQPTAAKAPAGVGPTNPVRSAPKVTRR